MKNIIDVTKKEYSDFIKYNKIVPVLARKMNINCHVSNRKGIMKGKKGDYLCIDTDGERWIINKEIFEQTYIKVIPKNNRKQTKSSKNK